MGDLGRRTIASARCSVRRSSSRCVGRRLSRWEEYPCNLIIDLSGEKQTYQERRESETKEEILKMLLKT